jgi:hypothetical protein
MESKTFKLGFSTRYRYRCHEEPVSSKSGFWLRGAVCRSSEYSGLEAASAKRRFLVSS